MGAELIHADRGTDKTKLLLASRNFATAPKMRLKPFIRNYSLKQGTYSPHHTDSFKERVLISP